MISKELKSKEKKLERIQKIQENLHTVEFGMYHKIILTLIIYKSKNIIFTLRDE